MTTTQSKRRFILFCSWVQGWRKKQPWRKWQSLLVLLLQLGTLRACCCYIWQEQNSQLGVQVRIYAAYPCAVMLLSSRQEIIQEHHHHHFLESIGVWLTPEDTTCFIPVWLEYGKKSNHQGTCIPGYQFHHSRNAAHSWQLSTYAMLFQFVSPCATCHHHHNCKHKLIRCLALSVASRNFNIF